jgi:hypothetical protein
MTGSGDRSRSNSEPDLPRLRRMAWTLLVLLVLENVLGIFANLYVTLPSGNATLAIFTSIPVLALHVLNAFLMLGLAAYFLLLCHRTGLRRLRNVAALEILFLVFAIQEGFAFAATQNNVYSFGMDVAFLLSVTAVARILYLVGRPSVDVPTEGIPIAV